VGAVSIKSQVGYQAASENPKQPLPQQRICTPPAWKKAIGLFKKTALFISETSAVFPSEQYYANRRLSR
jgi:hypothetical protein